MFPQLVAGPIVRAKDFLKQLKRVRIPNHLEKWNAIKMICYGLFQKVVIADNLSYFIDSAYENKSIYTGTPYWWLVVISFSFQIYADFSGYSLIARGLSKYMGYHFKMNFNHPYLSLSIREFWARWHISLSTWFKDYVYIPLGGSKRGIHIGIYALTTTMMLSGIWHGANFTFLVWAGLHTVFLLIERHTKYNQKLKRLPLVLISLVFFQVTISWVYFRSPTINQANDIISILFNFETSNLGFINFYINNLVFLALDILIELIIYLRKESRALSKFYKNNQINIDTMLISLSIVMIIFFRGEGQQFIYFQF
jgi:alginate O-acetyltransferase complex protein AlgI